MESSGAKVFVSCCQNHPAREASTTTVWFPIPHWLWLGGLWFSKWDSAVSRAATNVPGNDFEFPVRCSLASSLPAGRSTCSGKRNSSYRSSTARRSTQTADKVEPASSCHGTADGQRRPHHHRGHAFGLPVPSCSSPQSPYLNWRPNPRLTITFTFMKHLSRLHWIGDLIWISPSVWNGVKPSPPFLETRVGWMASVYL